MLLEVTRVRSGLRPLSETGLGRLGKASLRRWIYGEECGRQGSAVKRCDSGRKGGLAGAQGLIGWDWHTVGFTIGEAMVGLSGGMV